MGREERLWRRGSYRGVHRLMKREGAVYDRVETEKKSVADGRESKIARISSNVPCAEEESNKVPFPDLQNNKISY